MSRVNNEPEYRRRIRKKAEKDQQKAETERQKATDNTKQYEIIRSIYTIFHEYQRHYDEDRSRKQGDRFWEIAGVAALLLAAAVGVAAILVGTNDASEQRGAMQRQLTEMRIERRPWMTPADTVVKNLSINSDQVMILAEFTSMNIGKSPAKRVTVIPQLVVATARSDEEAAVQICKNLQSNRGALYGNSIFPNGNKVFPVSFGMPIEQIRQTKQALFRKLLQSADGQAARNIIATEHIFKNYVNQFIIAGCIGYLSQASDDVYVTGFASYLRVAPTQKGGSEHPMIDISKERFFKAEELELTATTGGTFAE